MYLVDSSDSAFPSIGKGFDFALPSFRKGFDFTLPLFGKGFGFAMPSIGKGLILCDKNVYESLPIVYWIIPPLLITLLTVTVIVHS